MRDLACAIHLHSLHSDGTGTVAQIARAAARSQTDVVLLTDHDTMAARRHGEEGRHGDVLVGVGVEVSPARGNHLLAFGLGEEIDHAGLDAGAIVAAVRDAGGLGIAAHPWSRGNPVFARSRTGMPFRDLHDVDGVELWSLVTDTVEAVRGPADVLRFVLAPDRFTTHPPPGHLAAYDALTARRRVVAIGGLDAHQVGVRVAGHVPLRLMGYASSFRRLRTHVLVDGDRPPQLPAVYGALREGRCYLARDSLAAPAGFAFEATRLARMGEQAAFTEGTELVVRLPRAAAVTLRRDGEAVAGGWTTTLRHRALRPGAYRVEALLPRGGRMRTWLISNPVYLR